MKARSPVLFLWFLILFIFISCGKEEAPRHAKTRQLISGVEIGRVEHREIDTLFSTPGRLRAVTQSVLTSKIMGNVTKILVKEGDRVEKGDVLIEIESQDILAKIRQAQGALDSARAALQNAESHYGRISGLFSRGSATQFERDDASMRLDSAKGMVKQAKGAVTEAKTMSQYSRIQAPVSGQVTRKMIDVGEQAAPGRPLLEMEDTQALQFETFAPESILPKLQPGQAVSVQIQALGDSRIPGTIAEMEATADPVSHSAKVKINLERKEHAISGMYGKALFVTGKRSAVLMPQEAVVTRGQLTSVYVVDADGIVRLRLIRTGNTQDSRIEVLSGLQGGERIALSKLDQLEDGMEVTE